VNVPSKGQLAFCVFLLWVGLLLVAWGADHRLDKLEDQMEQQP
jgi:hypothetical protein